jgi:putative transcriptional regulator
MESLQGYLLIALPSLGDPNFFHSVVLIAQHNSEGALGVILNRPLETSIRKAWSRVADEPYENDSPLFQGGPCSSPLTVLHAAESDSDIKVCPGIHFTMQGPNIFSLVNRNVQPIRFFIGNSGWSSEQLENEIREGSWLIAPAQARHIFGPWEHLWQELTRQATQEAVWPWIKSAAVPPDPSMN